MPSPEELEESYTRHMTRALNVLAQLEMAEDTPANRKVIVEATLAASDETMRGVLVGQLALAKLDLMAEAAEDDEDEEEDDEEDEDDEDD